MTKQTIVREVKETWTGVGRGGQQETLYQVIDEDGDRYSTKNGAFYSDQIGNPIMLQWAVELSKKLNPKTGKPYENKTLYEGTTPPAPKWNPPVQKPDLSTATLKRLEEKIDEILARVINLENPL